MNRKSNDALVRIVPGKDEEPMPVEIIEQSIVEIAQGMRRLNSTRLTRKAIVTLLHASCPGVNKSTIETVLSGLENLERNWLKPK